MDIVLSVGMCAQFQACPKESHLKAAKRILRYLKKIEDLVLFNPEGILLNINWIGKALMEWNISLDPHLSLGEPKTNIQ